MFLSAGDDTFPELLSPEPPPDFIFSPHYCQYFFANLGGREERNVGTVVQVGPAPLGSRDHAVM